MKLNKKNNNYHINKYLKAIAKIPLLTHEEEITLGSQVQELVQIKKLELELTDQMGQKPTIEILSEKLNLNSTQIKQRLKAGQRAKERMLSSNLGLVVKVAKNYEKRNIELLDLIQEGAIGLIRAVEKFNPTRGHKFPTYAYWWIRQGITIAIAEKSSFIRIPIDILEKSNKLKEGFREFVQKMNRAPTHSEITKYVKLSKNELNDLLLKFSQMKRPISLQNKIHDSEDEEVLLIDLLESDSSEILEIDAIRFELNLFLNKIPNQQREILKMRFGIDRDEPMSLTKICRAMSINRNIVRNLELDGLKRLRRLYKN